MDKNAIIRALRDTAQSASNAIASNVSGPVDLIAAGLRAGGVPINTPVGGSQWMAEKGLTRDVEMGVPRIVGETLGMAGPAVVAAKAPQIAAGLNQMASNAQAPRMLNPQTGAIVWHGSPHKFDKFDSSKIGTGEGAQAYGHGLYLAESPEVAAGYKKALSGYAADGKRLPSDVGAVVSNFDGDVAAAIAEKQGQLDKWLATGADAKHFIVKGLRDDLKKLTALQGKNLESTGAIYKVDLPDEAIAKMLDWDKPLSQQPKNVQQALNSKPLQDAINRLKQSGELANYSPDDMLKFRGEDFYDFMRQANGDSNVVPSEFLRQQGIPGIRYLDGGSRGVGQGTSNFVVFPGNETLLQILERNGQPLGLMGVR